MYMYPLEYGAGIVESPIAGKEVFFRPSGVKNRSWKICCSGLFSIFSAMSPSSM